MSGYTMSGRAKDSEDYPYDGGFAREVRDIVLKSSLTGVAATMMAVTVFSPAGFGGMIGTSLASGLGLDAKVSQADDVYANLPAYPTPLSVEEVAQIHNQLAGASSALELNRGATETAVSHVRVVALADGVAAFAPPPEPEQLAIFNYASPRAEPALDFATVGIELPQADIAVVDYAADLEPVAPFVAANLEQPDRLELSHMFDGEALYNPAG